MAIIGNPFIGNVPRQMSNDELAQAIRGDIADELEAIIAYEANILATNDERAKKILQHISDEEKNHVGELQQLLYLISPKDSEHIEKGKQAIQQQQDSNFQLPLQ
jgi:rubrerythrin